MRIPPPQEPAQRRDRLSFTSLIDVVFLLLVFFLMTFQIVLPEGDFDVSRTEQRRGAGPPAVDLPLSVRLVARENGALAGIWLHERRLPNSAALGHEVRTLIGSRTSPAPTKVYLHSDRGLHYQHTLDAIAALSQYRSDDGRLHALPTSVSLAGR
jgi:biopolymer transport protein ExbD